MFQISSVCNHRPPARRWWWNAESEKGQCRFGHDRARDAKCGGDHHRRDDVGQDVPNHDAQIARAEGPDCLDVLELPHDQNLTADDASHARPTDDSNRREHDSFRRLKRRDHRDEEQQRRER